MGTSLALNICFLFAFHLDMFDKSHFGYPGVKPGPFKGYPNRVQTPLIGGLFLEGFCSCFSLKNSQATSGEMMDLKKIHEFSVKKQKTHKFCRHKL